MIRKINLTDLIFLIFLFLTGLVIILGESKTEHFSTLIAVRLIAFVIIFTLVKLDTFYKNKIISFVRQFYPLLFTAYFYGETGYYNNIFFADLDGLFIQLEQSIFGFQPSLLFSLKFDSFWFNELMFFFYFSYYLIVIVFPLIVYFKNRDEFERLFFIIIFSFYTYYLIFVIFPVVGPQFYFPEQQAGISHPGIFGKMVKFFQAVGETPTGAFPSSHVGLSWIILFASAKINRKLFNVILPLAILICFSTVYIKAHYAVDIFAGVFSAILLYYLGNKIYDKYRIFQ
ncbi:MAG: phosphatase PAP2 family protein [Draconibacterium sp.]|nr:phosphatase PAP2 family protein [Draconibacterium sp.]